MQCSVHRGISCCTRKVYKENFAQLRGAQDTNVSTESSENNNTKAYLFTVHSVQYVPIHIEIFFIPMVSFWLTKKILLKGSFLVPKQGQHWTF